MIEGPRQIPIRRSRNAAMPAAIDTAPGLSARSCSSAATLSDTAGSNVRIDRAADVLDVERLGVDALAPMSPGDLVEQQVKARSPPAASILALSYLARMPRFSRLTMPLPPRSGKQQPGQQNSQGKRSGYGEKPSSFQDTVPRVLHILRSYQAAPAHTSHQALEPPLALNRR